jgi:RNA polymerase sigma factor (sigma-70 family)
MTGSLLEDMKTDGAFEQKNGDRENSESVAREYQLHRRSLLSYCALLVRNRDVAADIVQESFLRLIEQIRKSETPSNFRAWLFICARNLCFNRLRSEKVQCMHSSLIWSQADSMHPESLRFIEEVLGRMSPEERDLILLREQQRYSVSEIAEMIGISEEATRVRLYRIRKKMQELGRQ